MEQATKPKSQYHSISTIIKERIKMKLKRKAMAVISAIAAIVMSAIIQTNAAVDVAGGIEEALKEVTLQFKDVVAAIFAFATLVCLAVAVGKLVSGGIEHHRTGEALPWKDIAIAFGVAIVCSLAAGASFFEWFGV